METAEMNKKAMFLLAEWDPFLLGKGTYELEIAQVVKALYTLDYPTDLAKKIREVYEHTYETWIPLEECMQIAYKLLAVKYEAKCIIS